MSSKVIVPQQSISWGMAVAALVFREYSLEQGTDSRFGVLLGCFLLGIVDGMDEIGELLIIHLDIFILRLID